LLSEGALFPYFLIVGVPEVEEGPEAV
jgi:hypothetical protein